MQNDTKTPTLEEINSIPASERPAVFMALADALGPKLLAEFLLQVPFSIGPAEPGTREATNREFALAVAEELGPDHAQALYHFSVLVTKLA